MGRQPRHNGEAELTAREQDVRARLALGLTDAEIAQQLGVSTAAVSRHVSEIISKLGVRNRYEAASWPERPPWWAGALAPVAFAWRKAGVVLPAKASSLALVASGGTLAAALGGLGLLAVLVANAGGGADGDLDANAQNAVAATYPAGTPPSLTGAIDVSEPAPIGPPSTPELPPTSPPTSTDTPHETPPPSATMTPPAPTPVPTDDDVVTPPNPTDEPFVCMDWVGIVRGDLQEYFTGVHEFRPDQAATVDGEVQPCTWDQWSFIAGPPSNSTIGVKVLAQSGTLVITVIPPEGPPVSLEPGEEYVLSQSAQPDVYQISIFGQLPEGGRYRLMVCRSIYEYCTFSDEPTTPVPPTPTPPPPLSFPSTVDPF